MVQNIESAVLSLTFQSKPFLLCFFHFITIIGVADYRNGTEHGQLNE